MHQMSPLLRCRCGRAVRDWRTGISQHLVAATNGLALEQQAGVPVQLHDITVAIHILGSMRICTASRPANEFTGNHGKTVILGDPAMTGL